MKAILILILSIILFGFTNDFYVEEIKIGKCKISFIHNNSNKIEFAVKKGYQGFRYFSLNDSNQVYLAFDESPRSIVKIDSVFKSKMPKIPMQIGEPMQVAYIFFIIDKDGKVLLKGFERNTLELEYKLAFYKVIKDFDYKFEPAEIKGKKVASIFKYEINYNSL